MSVVRQKDMTAWSFLSQGSPIGFRDGKYCWQASRKEGEQQFILALNKPERSRMISDVLKEISGRECMFTAVPRDSAHAADNSSDDAYLETIYETFGRGPVNIVDEIK